MGFPQTSKAACLHGGIRDPRATKAAALASAIDWIDTLTHPLVYEVDAGPEPLALA